MIVKNTFNVQPIVHVQYLSSQHAIWLTADKSHNVSSQHATWLTADKSQVHVQYFSIDSKYSWQKGHHERKKIYAKLLNEKSQA